LPGCFLSAAAGVESNLVIEHFRPFTKYSDFQARSQVHFISLESFSSAFLAWQEGAAQFAHISLVLMEAERYISGNSELRCSN
ncbi:MAG TPA: hypothetical protein VF398_01670, partial [bacterium]